jgi:hypothetical protein
MYEKLNDQAESDKEIAKQNGTKSKKEDVNRGI